MSGQTRQCRLGVIQVDGLAINSADRTRTWRQVLIGLFLLVVLAPGASQAQDYDSAHHVKNERMGSIVVGEINGSSDHVVIRSHTGDVTIREINGSSHNILIEAQGNVTVLGRIDRSSSAIIRAKQGDVRIGEKIDGSSTVFLEAPNGQIFIGEKIDGGSNVPWCARNLYVGPNPARKDIRGSSVPRFDDCASSPRGTFEVTDRDQPIAPSKTATPSPPPTCEVEHFKVPGRYASEARKLGLHVCNPSDHGREDCVLIKPLRDIAKTKDAVTILAFAAAHHYWAQDEGNPFAFSGDYADRIADLAVTGRAAYRTFTNRFENGSWIPRDLTDADILKTKQVEQFIRTQAKGTPLGSGYTPKSSDVEAAVSRSLDRAYETAWAIRGPRTVTGWPLVNGKPQDLDTLRTKLGWIGFSPRDDEAHRRVNVGSSYIIQSNVIVNVPRPYLNSSEPTISVDARYLLLSDDLAESPQTFGFRTSPKDEYIKIPEDYEVMVYLHGLGSTAEESHSLGVHLLDEWRERGRKLVILAVDLPSRGYTEHIEHTMIAPSEASNYNTGYPILEFTEEFVVQFVNELDRKQRSAERAAVEPEQGLKDKIVAVLGGSLGGNLTLRLSRRPDEWLKRNMVAWSPASVWGRTWALATLDPFRSEPWYFDAKKPFAVGGSWDRFNEEERLELRSWYLNVNFESGEIGTQGYRETIPDSDPCKNDKVDSAWFANYELYNGAWRRWHWRLAHEQLIYMHGENTPVSEHHKYGNVPGYMLFDTHLLLVAGTEDNNSPEAIYDNTDIMASQLWFGKTTGRTLWLVGGHSLHNDVPELLSEAIWEFIKIPQRAFGPANLRAKSKASWSYSLIGIDGIELTWDYPSSIAPDRLCLNVAYKEDGQASFTALPADAHCRISAPYEISGSDLPAWQPGTTYRFWVQASRSGERDERSNKVDLRLPAALETPSKPVVEFRSDGTTWLSWTHAFLRSADRANFCILVDIPAGSALPTVPFSVCNVGSPYDISDHLIKDARYDFRVVARSRSAHQASGPSEKAPMTVPWSADLFAAGSSGASTPLRISESHANPDTAAVVSWPRRQIPWELLPPRLLKLQKTVHRREVRWYTRFSPAEFGIYRYWYSPDGYLTDGALSRLGMLVDGRYTIDGTPAEEEAGTSGGPTAPATRPAATTRPEEWGRRAATRSSDLKLAELQANMEVAYFFTGPRRLSECRSVGVAEPLVGGVAEPFFWDSGERDSGPKSYRLDCPTYTMCGLSHVFQVSDYTSAGELLAYSEPVRRDYDQACAVVPPPGHQWVPRPGMR